MDDRLSQVLSLFLSSWSYCWSLLLYQTPREKSAAMGSLLGVPADNCGEMNPSSLVNSEEVRVGSYLRQLNGGRTLAAIAAYRIADR